jgi:PPOX class probable F420-dependent enzyme
VELADRLATADILWLTTVGEGGLPQSSPVWFVWHDGAFHVASEPTAGKVANISARPAVAVHLEGAGAGDLVVTVEGEAALGVGLGTAVEAYVEKHAAGFARLGTSAEEYLAQFSVGVRITPTRWRVFSSD